MYNLSSDKLNLKLTKMTETLLNQIDKLNEYLHLESDINKKDFKYIDTMLQSMRNEAINYTCCCTELKCSGCKKPLNDGLCGSCCSDLASGNY